MIQIKMTALLRYYIHDSPVHEKSKKRYELLHWSEVVRNKAKGRISKRVFQENKAHQIFQKTNIYDPLIGTRTCLYQGVRNVRFLENLGWFVFLKRPFWDSPFCLITDEFTYTLLRLLSKNSKHDVERNFRA